MINRTNPYASPYSVEDPCLFYGRVDLLRLIFQKLTLSKYPPSLQIIGLSRIGKTSLLNILACLNNPTYISIVENLGLGLDPQMLSRLVFVKIDSLELATNKSSAFWNTIQEKLLQSLHGRIDIQQWPDHEQQSKPFDVVRMLLLQLQMDNRLTVFLFDEFDHIVQHLSDVLPNLRFLLEKNKGCLVYITTVRKELSQHEYYNKDETSHRLSPLFNYFAPSLYLGLLEETSNEQISNLFMRDQAQKQQVYFTDEDITFAMRIGGRHPEITRIVCKHLFDERQKYPGEPLNYPYIQKLVFYDAEGVLQNTINGELSSLQQQALEKLINRTDLDTVPENTWHNLEKRGLIISTPSKIGYGFFSPILTYFFHTLKHQEEQSSVIKTWPDQRIVQVGPKLELLSPNEWKVFEHLYLNAGMICTREELLQILGSSLSPSALEITISRLRQKIEEEADKPRFITTIRGQGYRFERQYQIVQSLAASPELDQSQRHVSKKREIYPGDKKYLQLSDTYSSLSENGEKTTVNKEIEDIFMHYRRILNKESVTSPEEFEDIVKTIFSHTRIVVKQSDTSVLPRVAQILNDLISKIVELNRDMMSRIIDETL